MINEIRCKQKQPVNKAQTSRPENGKFFIVQIQEDGKFFISVLDLLQAWDF
jgi:predicted  nucleic acid-binding Zn-ribbon protein